MGTQQKNKQYTGPIQSTVYMKKTNWDSFTRNITEVEINAMNN